MAAGGRVASGEAVAITSQHVPALATTSRDDVTTAAGSPVAMLWP